MASETRQDDVAAFRTITRRIYELISSPDGSRDWDSIRHLYHPRATLVRTGVDERGRPFVLAMSLDEYIDNVATLLDGVSFVETELDLRAEVFGNVAHAASVYAFERRTGRTVVRGRGVNFFNFVNEGEGWRIMNVAWDNERDGLSLEAAGLLP